MLLKIKDLLEFRGPLSGSLFVFAQLVIYSQQLLEGSTCRHRRNGGLCKPRPLSAASRGT